MRAAKLFEKGNPQAFHTPADLAYGRPETYGRLWNHRDTLFAHPIRRQT